MISTSGWGGLYNQHIVAQSPSSIANDSKGCFLMLICLWMSRLDAHSAIVVPPQNQALSCSKDNSHLQKQESCFDEGWLPWPQMWCNQFCTWPEGCQDALVSLPVRIARNGCRTRWTPHQPFQVDNEPASCRGSRCGYHRHSLPHHLSRAWRMVERW